MIEFLDSIKNATELVKLDKMKAKSQDHDILVSHPYMEYFLSWLFLLLEFLILEVDTVIDRFVYAAYWNPIVQTLLINDEGQ